LRRNALTALDIGNRFSGSFDLRSQFGLRKSSLAPTTLIRDAARERRLPQSHIDYLDAIEVRE